MKNVPGRMMTRTTKVKRNIHAGEDNSENTEYEVSFLKLHANRKR
jgi:hypothetical protein